MPGEGWQQEEISKNWKSDGPKNPLVPGKCNQISSIVQNDNQIIKQQNSKNVHEKQKPVNAVQVTRVKWKQT